MRRRAAAAERDTETRCEYRVPGKREEKEGKERKNEKKRRKKKKKREKRKGENYCPRNVIYTCPNYSRAEARPSPSFVRRTIRSGAGLLFAPRLDNVGGAGRRYTSHLHATTNARWPTVNPMTRKARPRAHEFVHRAAR